MIPREHNLGCGFYKNKLLSLSKRRINSGSYFAAPQDKNRPAGDIHSQSGALRYAHRRATRWRLRLLGENDNGTLEVGQFDLGIFNFQINPLVFPV